MASFGIGARGFLVRELQTALGGLKADGLYGAKTAQRVRELQQEFGTTADGRADGFVFGCAGLVWPDEFRRCLALVMELEGTGFGGCNSTDIDGAGFTFGCIGFTTSSGEVQRIICEFVDRVPAAPTYFSIDRGTQLLALARATSTSDART